MQMKIIRNMKHKGSMRSQIDSIVDFDVNDSSQRVIESKKGVAIQVFFCSRKGLQYLKLI